MSKTNRERDRWPTAWILAALAVLMLGCEERDREPVADSPGTKAKPAASASSTTTDAPAPTASAEAAADEPEPESVALQHVLVAYRGAKRAPQDVKRTKAEARQRADEALAKARAGTDFSELVGEYTDDPGGKANRGSLGKKKRDAFVKKFSDAAFKLKVGAISEPVETEFGFHIIKRNQ